MGPVGDFLEKPAPPKKNSKNHLRLDSTSTSLPRPPIKKNCNWDPSWRLSTYPPVFPFPQRKIRPYQTQTINSGGEVTFFWDVKVDQQSTHPGSCLWTLRTLGSFGPTSGGRLRQSLAVAWLQRTTKMPGWMSRTGSDRINGL